MSSRHKALVLILAVTSPIASAQVVKWTEANGQVHYSDHAPPDQKSQELKIDPAPKMPPPAAKPPQLQPVAQGPSNGPPPPAYDPMAAHPGPSEDRASRLAREAAARKAQDDKIIADCKRRRETYCNQSADKIWQTEQANEAKRAARDRFFKDAATLRQRPN